MLNVPLPPQGSTSWYPHYAALDSVARTGSDLSVKLSSFAGANDDAKLSAFMAYASALTYKGVTVQLDENRAYTFSTQQTLYNGFGITGPNRAQDQARGSMPLGNVVNLSVNGGWFYNPSGTTFGVYIGGLSINGNSTSRLVSADASSGVLWTSCFRDISFQNGASILGSVAQKLTVDAVTIDGWWNVNNIQETAFNMGGSDCYINPTIMLLDSPNTLLPVGNYLGMWSYFEKSSISNVYITCDQHSGFICTGAAGNAFLDINHCKIEGRNANTPCYGALIRCSTDISLKDSWLAYAMSNPSASGHGDKGVIHVTGGNVLIDGCFYAPANGVANTVPLVYVSGGHVRVRNIMANGFTPTVQQSVSGLINADDSVTVVTG